MSITGRSPEVVAEVQNSIAIIKFNRPAERNPLSTETLNQIDGLLNELTKNPQVKVVIFTGSEDAFLSGANLRELATLDAGKAADFSRRGQRLMQQIADAGFISIAAINGYCMGGGMDLALACSIRIASPGAVFAHPGARLGIITGWGGTQRLPRLIGKTPALEFFITARRWTSEEALQTGLITEIHEPVLEAAINLGKRLLVSDML